MTEHDQERQPVVCTNCDKIYVARRIGADDWDVVGINDDACAQCGAEMDIRALTGSE